MARGDLTDKQWERLQPHLPAENDPTKRGNRYKDHRLVINGILWVVRTGAPWRDLPERYGPWQTCYDRFNTWQKAGKWLELLHALQQEADTGRLPGQAIQWENVSGDSTTIKAHPHAGGCGVIVRPKSAKKKRMQLPKSRFGPANASV